MSYETIQVKPSTGVIGAEITGIDLRKPLGNQQFQEVHDALMAHQVIFFRDQKLTLDEHKAFGRLFGALMVHPNTKGPDGHPEILPIHADANSKRISGERWHSDVSCDPEPPMGSILNLKVIPPVGGDTIFASMYAAYDALSDGLKETLGGLRAVHSSRHVFGAERPGLKGRIGNAELATQDAIHPVVLTQPASGKEALYVNPGLTLRFDGRTSEEAWPLLRYMV